MTEPLCKNKFYNHVCQMILLSLYFKKHTKLQELRNTVDGMLRLQSKAALDDDTWKGLCPLINRIIGSQIITGWLTFAVQANDFS
jgi:hypothetical protein